MKRANMKKKCLYYHILFLAFSVSLIIGLTGCSDTEISETENDSLQNRMEEDYGSEIDSWETDTLVVGTVNHGIRHEEVKEIEMNGYITCTGEGVTLPYEATATGKATNLGFLLFVNGKPQAYHTDEYEEDNYCHVFHMEEDVEKLFDFRFMPSSGKKGELLQLTILSVYYPDFKPDMQQTSSYGMYHQTLAVVCGIKMETDASDRNMQMINDDIVKNVNVKEEELTQDYLSGPITLQYGMQEITTESLDSNIFNFVLLDGEYCMDNYLLPSKPFTITFEMCGEDGAEYYVTPFVDHMPISEAQSVTVKKGKVSSIDVTVDPVSMDDSSTFYFVAIPVDSKNFVQIKTASILLYKEDMLQ